MQRHSCAACHSGEEPMKGPPFLLLPLLSPPLLPPRPDSMADPFPPSAPRYNVTCHQGPLLLRRGPAAGCPVGRA
ncbi:hypothetical protein PBY51_004480 [Eleginops maclovinus]|uniref:Uncharacterized protein n=1 Tax=Eleginops maclovinus TaxID=56733 RepID=A0AAN7Y043_ELEMC|nr:hypothetical protein PBY51_004480 [Eleginops maclovinus]